jgi:hypothetical protein
MPRAAMYFGFSYNYLFAIQANFDTPFFKTDPGSGRQQIRPSKYIELNQDAFFPNRAIIPL